MGNQSSIEEDMYVKMDDTYLQKKRNINFGSKDRLINDSGRKKFDIMHQKDLSIIKGSHSFEGTPSIKKSQDIIYLFILGDYVGAFENYNSAINYTDKNGFKSSEICLIKPQDIKYV